LIVELPRNLPKLYEVVDACGLTAKEVEILTGLKAETGIASKNKGYKTKGCGQDSYFKMVEAYFLFNDNKEALDQRAKDCNSFYWLKDRREGRREDLFNHKELFKVDLDDLPTAKELYYCLACTTAEAAEELKTSVSTVNRYKSCKTHKIGFQNYWNLYLLVNYFQDKFLEIEDDDQEEKQVINYSSEWKRQKDGSFLVR